MTLPPHTDEAQSLTKFLRSFARFYGVEFPDAEITVERYLAATRTKHADFVTGQVRAGNFGPLITYLKAGYELTPSTRQVLIDILCGKLKKPQGRPKHSRISDYCRISEDVHIMRARGMPVEAAVKQVAADRRVHEKTVYNAIKKWPLHLLYMMYCNSGPAIK
jgi:hypothetical protein